MTNAAISDRETRADVITVRVEPELMMWVKAEADREARSVGGYVRALLLLEKHKEAKQMKATHRGLREDGRFIPVRFSEIGLIGNGRWHRWHLSWDDGEHVYDHDIDVEIDQLPPGRMLEDEKQAGIKVAGFVSLEKLREGER